MKVCLVRNHQDSTVFNELASTQLPSKARRTSSLHRGVYAGQHHPIRQLSGRPSQTQAYLNVKVPHASTMQLHIAQPTMRSDSRLAALGPDTADVLWNRLAVMDWPTCRKDQAKDI